MLLNLFVKNMALIEEADISFKEGLNILTGETGAGKSIIIGSINIALGGKVSADMIRRGTDYALVQLTFRVDDPKKIKMLKELDVEELDDGEVLISRKITANRSVVRVNGQTMTLSQLRQISAILIDIHGQHEHQSLMYESRHLELLDRFNDEETVVLKAQLRTLYSQYAQLRRKMDEMCMDEEQRQREISFMQFEINEIDEAQLEKEEDLKLEEKYRKMSNFQKIYEEISTVSGYIGHNDVENASDMISKAVRALNSVVTYDQEKLGPIQDQLMDIENLMNDLDRDVSGYIADSDFDVQEFEVIQNRLNLINSLKMKYGRTVEEITAYRDEKAARLEQLEDFEENRLQLTKELNEIQEKLEILCMELSKKRQATAEILSAKITQALVELNFVQVKFKVDFKRTEHYSANGFDSVRFLISTNPGEALHALAKTASGGEMSRIMLAIKAVLADKDDIETLIFDEIDTGISGRTAQMVAGKMHEIAADHQVICITHLPQIAAMADSHFIIEKNISNQSTVTTIHELSEQASVEELARLLGGMQITDTVLESAREMKKFARRNEK